MGRVTGIQKYYCFLFLMFLFLTILCFAYVKEFEDDKCEKEVETSKNSNNNRINARSTDSHSDTDFNENTEKQTVSVSSTDSPLSNRRLSFLNTSRVLQLNLTSHTTNTTTEKQTVSVSSTDSPLSNHRLSFLNTSRVLQSNLTSDTTNTTTEEATSLIVVPNILAYFYLIESLLVLIQIIMLYYFSNIDISRFASLNWCQRLMGKLSKLLPYIIILIHYFILILICAFIVLVFGIRDCEDAKHTDINSGKIKKGEMQKHGESLAIVLIVFWLLMHIIGGYLRRHVYYDSFFYQPEQNNARIKKWLIIRCGP